jgi:hypothetical protein
MAGRSLWSVLMVAWLSATNLPTSTETSPSEVALSEPMGGGDAVRLAGGIEDDAAVAPAGASAETEC